MELKIFQKKKKKKNLDKKDISTLKELNNILEKFCLNYKDVLEVYYSPLDTFDKNILHLE